MTAAAGRVTLKHLAAHLGLTSGTVSIVLNSSPGFESIPEHTRRRIFEGAKQLGYRPNFFARALTTKRTYLVAVLTTSLANGYDTSLLGGIEEYLADTQYLYVVASHAWSKRRLQRMIEELTDRGVEGFILINADYKGLALTLPTVIVGTGPSVEGAFRIAMDNQRGARLAVQHLYALGHRKIAFVKGDPLSLDSVERWEALQLSARELKLIVDRELVFDSSLFHPILPGIQRLLDLRHQFTAIIAFNDTVAISVMSALTREGVSVPEEVSIIGFDDIPMAANICPSLTTVRQPLAEMGRLAAERLLFQIENTKCEPSVLSVEPELVVRNSTGQARIS